MVNRRKKLVKWIDTIKTVGQGLVGKKVSRAVGEKALSAVQAIPSFAKGGKVKRTGLIRAHKNEIVIPAKTACALKKLLK
jgi:hypothetical protein